MALSYDLALMNPSATAKHRLAASALGILLLINASAAPNPNNAKVDKLFAQWDRFDADFGGWALQFHAQ